MNWVEGHLPELVPEWMGYPMKRQPHGYEFDLGHHERGLLLSPDLHYWDGAWKPVDNLPVQAHDGSFGYPHDPAFRIHPGGFIRAKGVTSGLRSMGVVQAGRYVPLWTAGTFGVSHGVMVQALGPYEVRTHLDSMKQEIMLPSIPSLDADALVLDYWGSGMGLPVVIGADGHEAGMTVKATPHGRRESIALDVLSGMRFPVILDPEICGAGDGYALFGRDADYATAHATMFTPAHQKRGAVGQSRSNDPYIWCYRFMVKMDTTGYSGTINTCDLHTSCASAYAAGSCPFDDNLHFVEYDWSALEPIGVGDYQTMFSDVLTAPLGAVIATVAEMAALGCGLNAACAYNSWHALSAADVAYLDAFGLGNSLYWGHISYHDSIAQAPPAVPGGCSFASEYANLAGPGWTYCPMCLRINVGGGFTWLIGG